MKRALIIPAAGRGSRLGGNTPKVLVPVNGRPMLDYLLERYRDVADSILLVVHPSFADQVKAHLKQLKSTAEIFLQEQQTGMLDAIQVPATRVLQLKPEEVWVTWCDQVTISEGTVNRLAQAMVTKPEPQLAFPTILLKPPYIHFARNREGTITGVLQRREGDTMSEEGEGDIGLFALTFQAYAEMLAAFAAMTRPSSGTGERNFLPFIPWLAQHGLVRTIPAAGPIEAVGINTPEDLARVGKHLAS